MQKSFIFLIAFVFISFASQQSAQLPKQIGGISNIRKLNKVPESCQGPLVVVGAILGGEDIYPKSERIGKFEEDVVEFMQEIYPIHGVYIGTGASFVSKRKVDNLVVVTSDFIFFMQDAPKDGGCRFILQVVSNKTPEKVTILLIR